MIRAGRRALRVASLGLPVVVVVTMASCTGGDADVGPSTVPRIGATNYVTQPIVTMPPTTVAGQTTVPGEVAGAGTEYRIRSGDTVSGIANRFGITMNELVEYNDWDGPGHLLIQGNIVKIPPFADLPDAGDTTEPPETLYIEGPTCPDGSEQETYEIESGDFLGRVAGKLEVTVEALEAANEHTSGFEIFYPGLEIMVPCEGEGEDEGESADGTSVETTEG